MTNKIDKTYFWGENKITGLTGTTDTALAQVAELNDFISKYQPIYFKKMFGMVEIPAELLALVIDTTLKLSPLANFVFYYWQKANINTPTNTGMKTLVQQNTVDQSPIPNMVTQWNEMVNKNIDVHNYLLEQETLEIAPIEAVSEVLDPPTPSIEAVEGYTLKFKTDILPNVNYCDSIFRKQNQIGI